MKVLIVEDSPDSRELLAAIIRKLGCEVAEAEDGAIGVDKALTYQPDLILMDVEMPRMNGIEATSRLKTNALTRDTPVVLVTAHTRWEVRRQEALAAGAAELLRKPLSLETIRRVLKTYLKGTI
jgi:CheY-like chemotaxis protein